MEVKAHAELGALYERYRPQAWDELLPTFNVDGLKSLLGAAKHPRVFLFKGESGTGKTTVARIIAQDVNQHLDYEAAKALIFEMNAADTRGIDDVRELKDNIEAGQMLFGTVDQKKIYILDECHQLTDAAQNVLLKVLEDPPSNCYIFLCTTDDTKLISTLVGRCHPVEFRMPPSEDIEAYLSKVLASEDEQVDDKIKTQISEDATSLRDALHRLQGAILGDELPIADVDTLPDVVKAAKYIVDGDWGHVAKIVGNLRKYKLTGESCRIQLSNYLRGWLIRNVKSKEEADRVSAALGCLTEPIVQPDAHSRLVYLCYKAWKEAHR